MAGRQEAISSHQVLLFHLVLCAPYEPSLLSGDGTLSVMDVRANKTEPLAQSEDQEDELLSITAIKGFANYCARMRTFGLIISCIEAER